MPTVRRRLTTATMKTRRRGEIKASDGWRVEGGGQIQPLPTTHHPPPTTFGTFLMLWRFRGTPHYLGQQSSRLGVTPVLADRARNNQEIYRVSVLLAQLCERYHKARKEDGRPVLAQTEMAQVRGTLQQAEQECAKLHALAATAATMIDEAYAAFGTDQPQREFAVMSNFDVPTIPMPLGDGTAGVTDAEAYA